MDSMQAEAMRRVREMHSPPLQRGENSQKPANHQGRETSRTKEPDPPVISGPAPVADFTCENPLFADKEKFLILALIMILSSEEQSDPMLTLALLYLII